LNVDFTASLPDALSLAASLAVGLLIGLERGWRQRELSEGGRVAGLRTFALTGLLGGLLASLPVLSADGRYSVVFSACRCCWRWHTGRKYAYPATSASRPLSQC
jgi:uncharacterized membrane protein YhiD involved in acid resistance